MATANEASRSLLSMVLTEVRQVKELAQETSMQVARLDERLTQALDLVGRLDRVIFLAKKDKSPWSFDRGSFARRFM